LNPHRENILGYYNDWGNPLTPRGKPPYPHRGNILGYYNDWETALPH